jgi:proline iminopeptidase
LTEKIDKAAGVESIPAGPFELGYVVEGSGHPTIVIGSHLYYPRVFSSGLHKHLQLIFMDHRGFATSPGSVDQSEYELEAIVDDVEALRKKLDLPRVAVIGHSGHSFMALEYAKRYPEHTSHLIMIGISPDIGPASMELAEQNFQALADGDRRAAENENMSALPDEQLGKLPPDQAFVRGYIRNAARTWFDPRYDCTSLWDGVTPNVDVFGYIWGRVFANIDVTEGIENLAAPVFLALGRYDFIVGPPSCWDPLLPRFRDITLQVFERSGHTPQFEEQPLFDESLLSWMESRA